MHHLMHKLETMGTLLTAHGGARPHMSEDTVQDVRCRLLDSPKKSLQRLSQGTGMFKSTYQRATQKAKIHAYDVTAVHELKEPHRVRESAGWGGVATWFLPARWCDMSNDTIAEIESSFEDSIISKGLWPPWSPDLTPPDVVCMKIGRKHYRTCETTSRARFKWSHRRLSIAPFKIWNVVYKHVWKPKVDTFSTCCDSHVFSMKQGMCVINFMLLNVFVGKLC
jgi:hypothetical protein